MRSFTEGLQSRETAFDAHWIAEKGLDSKLPWFDSFEKLQHSNYYVSQGQRLLNSRLKSELHASSNLWCILNLRPPNHVKHSGRGA